MTKNLPANPLAGIIAAAAKTPAAGAIAKIKSRTTDASDAIVVVADVSSSMAEQAGARSKATILRESLESVMPAVPGARLIAFESTPHLIECPKKLPKPEGGTALHLALDLAATFRPRHTVVISDGHPDNRNLALAAAEKMTGTIDVIYVGPENDGDGLAFMRQLARSTGGRATHHNLYQAPSLIPAMRQALMIEGPKS